MGLFNKTAEEVRVEEEQKRLKQLSTEIKNLDVLDEDSKKFLIEYIDKIRKGNPNDFHDIDTLTQVILKMVTSNFRSFDDLEEHFLLVIEIFKQVVSRQKPDYERNKEEFLNHFIGSEGIIYNGLFNSEIYSMFTNKNDFFEIMNIINADSDLAKNFYIIEEYIKSVCKYCLNQDMLKRDIIAYLSGFSSVLDGDYEKYSNSELENAKKRIGVYNLSPKDLSACDSKLRKVEDYLDQFDIHMKKLTEEHDAVTSLLESGKEDIDQKIENALNDLERKQKSILDLLKNSKKEIKEETKKSTDSLRRMIDEQKQQLTEKLDAYLLELEEVLKGKSDETFKQIIETYKNQISEFSTLFKSYSMSASKDLIAIQNATQESIRTLQNYVTNEPQLQDLLAKAQEQNSVREKIVELVSKEEKLLESVKVKEENKEEQTTIPGYDRIMIPYRRMILPEKVSNIIIPAFDESIPFDIKIKEIERKMQEKEARGEIFHEKVKQIAIDLIEGDWPYLWGPSGTGKSYMLKQTADLLGIPFIKAGKITEPYSILGYNDPQGRYRVTPTFMATLYGYLLSLDEFDNGNPDTQIVLNDIYSELLNKIENPHEVCEVMFGDDIPVDINPNFRMIAAGNTSGEGENSVFSSRAKMDESIQERVTPIYIDYDNRVEERILRDYPAWYQFFTDFREVCANYAKNNGLETPQGSASTRDAAAIKKYIEHNSKSIDQIMEEKFVQTKNSEYRKALGKAIASKYDIDYNKCDNPDFDGPSKEAKGKVLARKFIYYCKQ